MKSRLLKDHSIDDLRLDCCSFVFIEEATHWVQHEEAGRVNELIGAFLGEGA